MTNANNQSGSVADNLQLLGLALALIGYSLSWIVTTNVGLQANAYDLAEWMTLHPTVRATSTFLLPALLLRLALPIIGLLLVRFARRTQKHTVVLAVVAIVIGFALIPPVDFFRGQFRDPNYLQQAVLWVLYSLLALYMLVFNRNSKYRQIDATAILALILLLAFALWQARDLMARYEISVAFGVGYPLFLFGGLLYLGGLLQQIVGANIRNG
jgi:hypothetical protein